MINIRTGFGYDVHQLETGRDFWLGGIKLDAPFGAKGHSDADILIHVICDALLGAANLRDIGYHFPDSDPQYKGIDSKKLLKSVIERLQDKNYAVGNIDSTICLQNFKINPHIPEMKKCLSEIVLIPEDHISIKATTSEKMGFVGRGEGIAAYASVLIYKTEA